jgi:hypothetical protein
MRYGKGRRRRNPGTTTLVMIAIAVGIYMFYKNAQAKPTKKILKPGDADFVGPLPQ